MSEIEFKDLTARPTTAGDSFVGIDSAGEAARITIPSSFSVGTAAYANLGTAGNEVPLNGNLGTAANVDTGTAPGDVPLNSDLGTAAYANTGVGASDVPLNSNLGTFAYEDFDTGPFTANGYIQFPGGLILQWATQTVSATNGSTHVLNFPITFPTGTLQAIMSATVGTTGTGTANEGTKINSFTASSLTWEHQWDTQTAQDYRFFMIGH